VKFTLVKDLKSDDVMRPTLTSVLFFSFIYLITDFFVKHFGFGITPDAITLTLLGDEQQYLDPLDKNVFLEFWHSEIFFVMFISFIITTIYIRTSSASKIAIISVNIMLVSAIISLISLPLSFFYSELFVYPYVFSFYLWHLLGIVASILSLKVLNFA
jgi:hypothetical protein